MTSAYSNGQPGENKSSGLRLIVGAALVILGFIVTSSGSTRSATRTPDSEDSTTRTPDSEDSATRTPDSEDKESNKSPQDEQKESQKISRRERGIYTFCVSTFPALLATYATLATARESNSFILFRDGTGPTDIMNWFWWIILGCYTFSVFAILVIAAHIETLESSGTRKQKIYKVAAWGLFLLVALAFLVALPGLEDSPGIKAALALASGGLSVAVTHFFFKLPA